MTPVRATFLEKDHGTTQNYYKRSKQLVPRNRTVQELLVLKGMRRTILLLSQYTDLTHSRLFPFISCYAADLTDSRPCSIYVHL